MAGYRQFVIEIIVISLLPTRLSQSKGERFHQIGNKKMRGGGYDFHFIPTQ